tara:strand:- start:138 stop:335 length:198 start_codon:yes stop_codon:yes gene_type:complete
LEQVLENVVWLVVVEVQLCKQELILPEVQEVVEMHLQVVVQELLIPVEVVEHLFQLQVLALVDQE